MDARQIVLAHRDKLSDDEHEDDVIWMVQALAEERAKALGQGLSPEAYEFSAAVLCLLLEGFKLGKNRYKAGVAEMRAFFRGIRFDDYAQGTSRVIRARAAEGSKAEDVIALASEQGLERLFKDAIPGSRDSP